MLHYDYNYIRFFRKAGNVPFLSDVSIDAVNPDAIVSLWDKVVELLNAGKIEIPNDAYALAFFTRPLIRERFGRAYEGYPQNFSEVVYFSD